MAADLHLLDSWRQFALRISILTGIVALSPAAIAAPPDAGVAADGGTGSSASPTDAGADAKAVESIIDLSTRRLLQVEELKRATEAIGKLGADQIIAPEKLSEHFDLDLANPWAVDQWLKQYPERARTLKGRTKEAKRMLAALRPILQHPIRKYDRLKKRRRRLPKGLVSQATQARQQLNQLRTDYSFWRAKHTLIETKALYLRRTQPQRSNEKEKRELTANNEAQRQHKANQTKTKALAEEQQAEQARAAALKAQREARSEAERLLAKQRADYEGLRAKQAKRKRRFADDEATMARLSSDLERFRGRIAAALDRKSDIPRSSAFDPLYDEVVEQLKDLRPQAIGELTASMRGLADIPQPADELPSRVRQLEENFRDEVNDLEARRQRLEKTAAILEKQQQRLRDQRLSLLQREVGWLNRHRTALLRRVSHDKYGDLTGLTPSSVAQFAREISQLTFDLLHLLLTRLRQIDEIPSLLRDLFAVGGALWTLIKILFLLWLVRYVIRNWEDWLGAAVPRISRTAALGRFAVASAKTLDLFRHAGPALMQLFAALWIYRAIGADNALLEFRIAYGIFFWVTLYRVFLRLVEALAKYTGIERALRSADEQEEYPEDFEGPPAPQRVARPSGFALAAISQKTIDAPLLLVHSFRTTSRYVLAVLLILELADLLVGQGTIYGITLKFCWWAALPFLFYFLQLWRPHILQSYKKHAERKATDLLGGWIKRSEGRFYSVFLVGGAFAVIFAARIANFGRQHLSSLDTTKRFLAFVFRRQVERHAEERGRVLDRRQDLPETITRQFPMDALTPHQRPMRPTVLDEIREIYGAWTTDQIDGSLALVGGAGCGKSTCLAMLDAELNTPILAGDLTKKLTSPDQIVRWVSDLFSFNPPAKTEAELIEKIREDTRLVIAIDNCHNMFLRRIGGFAGWKAFIRIVNETCDNALWILTFNRQAWDYLNNVSSRVHYFRRLISFKPWDEAQIRQLIMARMRRARFRVSFSELIVAEVAGIGAAEQLGRTSTGYFRLLWDATGGNPRLAGHYWLASLMPKDDAPLVKVHLFESPDIAELEALPDDIAFILAAICEHENLTAAQAHQIIGLPLDFCNFAFRLCTERGYLYADQRGRTRPSWRWQPQILRYLRRKHLLHGQSS